MRVRYLPVIAVASAAVVALVAVPSAFARTGPPVSAPGEAGYAATGEHFTVSETWVRLPDAGRFAANVGAVSPSVQLWTTKTVLDLSVSACTDVSCRPGGKSKTYRYHLQFAVYSRKTGALICATSAPKARCPGVPRSWRRARLSPGHTASLSLVYDPPWTSVFVMVNGYEYQYPVSTHSVFRQARIGLEFGTGPLRHPDVRAPRHPVKVASFGIPRVPPFAAEIAGGGHSACFTHEPWTSHLVRMMARTAKHTLASAGKLSYYGCDFTVSLGS